ncbi:PQQ-dependent sugar dehydrogenase [Otariodibacter sp.]|uniref:PQQ-dependent sugar dehydrogenase n=1 Tax=Otariodibacter sp. TaxID=3030919 RepID=UPI002611248D|nr:PQQ-dependent sugar dehydrogenase [Otariodibacter sp.]
MKRKILAILISFYVSIAYSAVKNPTVNIVDEHFNAKVLIDDLHSPTNMVWGYDGNIWLIEKQSNQLSTVNPETGERSFIYTPPLISTEAKRPILLSFVFHPDFLKNKQSDYLYLYQSYNEINEDQGVNQTWGKISRLTYDNSTKQFINEITLLDKIPSNVDRPSGILRFGSDQKLYLALDDNNEPNQQCEKTMAQKIPSVNDIVTQDFSAYQGKVLRINTDGTIPEDNPRIANIKSHIFAYGFHFPKDMIFSGDHFFSVDQGTKISDELNIIEAGKNYGWPNLLGNAENTNCDAGLILENMPKQTQLPIKTFSDTIEPSGLAYYPKNGTIPFLQNSILITGYKTGTLYQIPLNEEVNQANGNTIAYVYSNNHYQSVLISPDGKNIYIATDNTKNSDNLGAIITFTQKP